MSFARHIAKLATNELLDVLDGEQRIRLAHYILNRELGDGIGDPEQNGEYTLLRNLRKTLIEKPVVFDVGANVGAWTLELSQHVSADTTVYAFEPDSATFAELSRTLAGAPHASRFVAIRAALSDTDGEAELHSAGALAETNSLVFRSGITEGEKMRVPVLRADNFCAQRGIERVAFAKIDVEGHEFAALRGFEALLDMQRVDCIQFEYGGTWIDARVFLADVFKYLSSRGYRLGKLMPNGIRPLPSYTRALERFSFANFVAMTPHWSKRCGALLLEP